MIHLMLCRLGIHAWQYVVTVKDLAVTPFEVVSEGRRCVLCGKRR